MLLQSWITMDVYAEVEKVCNKKRWTLSRLVREGVALAAKKHAEEKEAA